MDALLGRFHDLNAALYLAVEPLDVVSAVDLGPVFAENGHIGQYVKGLRGAPVAEVHNAREWVGTKLNVQGGDAQIKIEVTPVLCGCVFASELRSVSAAVEEAFVFAEMQVVSFADLYAGKIVAALDRQHPRDLFDIRDLLANEGIDDELRRAFIVYLVSHDRLISELVAPRRKNLTQEFAQGFEGMTAEPITLDDLAAAREALITTIIGGMPAAHRDGSSVASRIGASSGFPKLRTCRPCGGSS